jgi:hypothetical protein
MRVPPEFLQALFTLALALAGALSCRALHTPLPWLLGPLLAVGAATVLRVRTRSLTVLRNAGQCTIGIALGLYFTPAVGVLVLGLWWAIALAIGWALLLGWGFGLWLQRCNAHHIPGGLDRATTWFASAIGGAAEMTLLAERAGARTDLVAAAHSLRLLLVAVFVPFGLQFSGLHGLDGLPPALREVQPAGLAGLYTLAVAGGWLMLRLDRANPWFMGALLATMALTLADVRLSALPPALSNAAQLLIGASLGVRFTPAFVHTAPRWLASVALGTVGLLVLCGLFAWALAQFSGLHVVTLVLATAPGGIAEMSITAKVLQLGAPVVTAFQVCRLLAVLLWVEPAWRWQRARR